MSSTLNSFQTKVPSISQNLISWRNLQNSGNRLRRRVFLDVKSYSQVQIYRRYEGTCEILRLQGVTSQNTLISAFNNSLYTLKLSNGIPQTLSQTALINQLVYTSTNQLILPFLTVVIASHFVLHSHLDANRYSSSPSNMNIIHGGWCVPSFHLFIRLPLWSPLSPSMTHILIG